MPWGRTCPSRSAKLSVFFLTILVGPIVAYSSFLTIQPCSFLSTSATRNTCWRLPPAARTQRPISAPSFRDIRPIYSSSSKSHASSSPTRFSRSSDDPNQSVGPIGALLERFRSLLFIVRQRWFLLRRAVRSITEKYTVYVLECEHGKYYVGSTSHKRQRFREHNSKRSGSKWTRLHRPVRLMKQFRRVPEQYYLGLESQVTAQMMLEYGVNNVRGAQFSQPRQYTREDIAALTGFLGHLNNLSYDDVQAQLQQTLPSPVEEDIVPRPKRRMRAPMHPKAASKRVVRPKPTDRCNRCGELGHWARDCLHEIRCYQCGQGGHIASECPN